MNICVTFFFLRFTGLRRRAQKHGEPNDYFLPIRLAVV
jgi:hypothetical protein